VNPDQIRKRMADGFRPFVLRLSDGRKFRVPHPEFILIGRDIVVVLEKDGLARIIDADHIVSIEDTKARKR
jgi:hypothetical protein